MASGMRVQTEGIGHGPGKHTGGLGLKPFSPAAEHRTDHVWYVATLITPKLAEAPTQFRQEQNKCMRSPAHVSASRFTKCSLFHISMLKPR